jgi:hypothetical protein
MDLMLYNVWERRARLYACNPTDVINSQLQN